MTPTIDIAGLTFDDGTRIDQYGIRWIWQDLAGWFTTNVTYTAAPPASGEGEVALEVRRGSRPLTLTGFVGVEDLNTWWLASNIFSEAFRPLCSRATPGTIVVHEPQASRSLSVYVSGPAQLSKVGIWQELSTGEVTTGFNFMVPLVAPDPVKVTL